MKSVIIFILALALVRLCYVIVRDWIATDHRMKAMALQEQAYHNKIVVAYIGDLRNALRQAERVLAEQAYADRDKVLKLIDTTLNERKRPL